MEPHILGSSATEFVKDDFQYHHFPNVSLCIGKHIGEKQEYIQFNICFSIFFCFIVILLFRKRFKVFNGIVDIYAAKYARIWLEISFG
jgi:hypothetical protein